jgi:hypothetical protein
LARAVGYRARSAVVDFGVGRVAPVVALVSGGIGVSVGLAVAGTLAAVCFASGAGVLVLALGASRGAGAAALLRMLARAALVSASLSGALGVRPPLGGAPPRNVVLLDAVLSARVGVVSAPASRAALLAGRGVLGSAAALGSLAGGGITATAGACAAALGAGVARACIFAIMHANSAICVRTRACSRCS